MAGYSTALRNRRLDAITTELGANGKLRIYSGTRPATGGAATTLLAELTLGATLAPAAVGAVLTANAITDDSAADATGTPTWARLVTSGGTFVADISAAVGSGELNLLTAITAGQPVQVTSLVITGGNP